MLFFHWELDKKNDKIKVKMKPRQAQELIRGISPSAQIGRSFLLERGALEAFLDGVAEGQSPAALLAARSAPVPSLKWCSQALVGGHCCLAMVVQTLEAMFSEEATPSTDELTKDFQYAWQVMPDEQTS